MFHFENIYFEVLLCYLPVFFLLEKCVYTIQHGKNSITPLAVYYIFCIKVLLQIKVFVHWYVVSIISYISLVKYEKLYYIFRDIANVWALDLVMARHNKTKELRKFRWKINSKVVSNLSKRKKTTTTYNNS